MTTAMATAMIIGATTTMGNITMDNCGSGNGITSMEGRRSSYEDDDHDDDDDDDDDEEERMMMQIMEDYAKSFEIQSSDTPTSPSSSSSSSSPSSPSSSIPPLSLIKNTLKRTLTSLSMLSSQSNDESIDKIKKGDTLLTNENEDDEDDNNDNYVNDDKEYDDENTTVVDFLVVGYGKAGSAAVRTLRKRCPDATIGVVDPYRSPKGWQSVKNSHPLEIEDTKEGGSNNNNGEVEGKETTGHTTYVPGSIIGTNHHSMTVSVLENAAKVSSPVSLTKDQSSSTPSYTSSIRKIRFRHSMLIATGSRGAPIPSGIVHPRARNRVLELNSTRVSPRLRIVTKEGDKDSPSPSLSSSSSPPASQSFPVMTPERVRSLAIMAASDGADVTILGGGKDAVEIAAACSLVKKKKGNVRLIFGGPGLMSDLLPLYLSTALAKRLRRLGVTVEERTLVRYIGSNLSPVSSSQRLEVHTARSYDTLDTRTDPTDLVVVAPSSDGGGGDDGSGGGAIGFGWNGEGLRGTAILPVPKERNFNLQQSSIETTTTSYMPWSDLEEEEEEKGTSANYQDRNSVPISPLTCSSIDGRIATSSELSAASDVYAAGSVARYPCPGTGRMAIAGGGCSGGGGGVGGGGERGMGGGGASSSAAAGVCAASNMAADFEEWGESLYKAAEIAFDEGVSTASVASKRAEEKLLRMLEKEEKSGGKEWSLFESTKNDNKEDVSISKKIEEPSTSTSSTISMRGLRRMMTNLVGAEITDAVVGVVGVEEDSGKRKVNRGKVKDSDNHNKENQTTVDIPSPSILTTARWRRLRTLQQWITTNSSSQNGKSGSNRSRIRNRGQRNRRRRYVFGAENVQDYGGDINDKDFAGELILPILRTDDVGNGIISNLDSDSSTQMLDSSILAQPLPLPSALPQIGVNALCIGSCDASSMSTHGYWWTNRNTAGRGGGGSVPVYGAGVVHYVDATGSLRGLMLWGLPFTDVVKKKKKKGSGKGSKGKNEVERLNTALVERIEELLRSRGMVSTLAFGERWEDRNRNDGKGSVERKTGVEEVLPLARSTTMMISSSQNIFPGGLEFVGGGSIGAGEDGNAQRIRPKDLMEESHLLTSLADGGDNGGKSSSVLGKPLYRHVPLRPRTRMTNSTGRGIVGGGGGIVPPPFKIRGNGGREKIVNGNNEEDLNIVDISGIDYDKGNDDPVARPSREESLWLRREEIGRGVSVAEVAKAEFLRNVRQGKFQDGSDSLQQAPVPKVVRDAKEKFQDWKTRNSDSNIEVETGGEQTGGGDSNEELDNAEC